MLDAEIIKYRKLMRGVMRRLGAAILTKIPRLYIANLRFDYCKIGYADVKAYVEIVLKRSWDDGGDSLSVRGPIALPGVEAGKLLQIPLVNPESPELVIDAAARYLKASIDWPKTPRWIRCFAIKHVHHAPYESCPGEILPVVKLFTKHETPQPQDANPVDDPKYERLTIWGLGENYGKVFRWRGKFWTKIRKISAYTFILRPYEGEFKTVFGPAFLIAQKGYSVAAKQQLITLGELYDEGWLVRSDDWPYPTPRSVAERLIEEGRANRLAGNRLAPVYSPPVVEM